MVNGWMHTGWMEDRKNGMANEIMNEWTNVNPGITIYRFCIKSNLLILVMWTWYYYDIIITSDSVNGLLKERIYPVGAN